MNKNKWKFIVQLMLSVLTAIATTLGMESCM
ncbi:smalltalk protein [Prevotella nigrescens]|nr:smalltalk protein [Prevotella nigrescens]